MICESDKSGAGGALVTDPNLAHLIARWPTPPDATKAVIVALVRILG